MKHLNSLHTSNLAATLDTTSIETLNDRDRIDVDRIGVDRIGVDRIGVDRIGVDRIDVDKIDVDRINTVAGVAQTTSLFAVTYTNGLLPESLLPSPTYPSIYPSMPQPISPSVIATDGDYHGLLQKSWNREIDEETYYRNNGIDGGDGGRGGNGSGDDPERGGSQDPECRWCVERLSAFQDGELESDETHRVADHLDMCASCARIYTTIQATDNLLEREWCADAPLPSSLEFSVAIDGIMASIPEAQSTPPLFPHKRVHARSRWIRFATNMAGGVAILLSLWASYHLGYLHGHQNRLLTTSQEITQTTLPPLDKRL